MKCNRRWVLILSAVVAATTTCLNSNCMGQAANEATTMMNSYDAEQRAAAAARLKDTAWKPSCKEVQLIQIAERGNPSALKNFCLNKDGNILACYAGAAKSSDPKKATGIRVYSPKGELLRTLPLDIAPET